VRAPRPGDVALAAEGLVTAAGDGAAAALAAIARRAPVAGAGDPAAQAARVEDRPLDLALPRELEAQARYLNPAGRLAARAVAALGADAFAPVAPERRALHLAQMDAHDWSTPDLVPAVLEATDGLRQPLEGAALNRGAVRRTKPFFLLDSLKNNAFSFLSAWRSLRGANTSSAGYAGSAASLFDVAVRAVAAARCDLSLFVAAARPTSEVALEERRRHGLLGLDGPPGDGAAALLLRRVGDAPGHPWVAGLALATGRPAAPGAIDEEAVRAAIGGALRAAACEPGAVGRLLAPARLAPLAARAGLGSAEAIDAAAALGDLALARFATDLALAAAFARQDGRPVLVVEAAWLGQTTACLVAPPAAG
jgi:hypothetical protein